MKYTTGLVLASAAAVTADCSVATTQEGGNYYCQAVSHISYNNLAGSGSYKAVSYMDSEGTCNFSSKTYSGSIAPFDEELSVHIRGPTQLKQFAVYTPSSSSSKRDQHKSHKRHGHQHLHKRADAEKEERAVGDTVIATINGKVVSWINTYTGETAAAAAASVSTTTTATSAKTTSKATSTKTSTTTTPKATAATVSGGYKRIAYYNAESQTADGITFLNNMGGSGSGVWDTSFGNSLSYASSDGKACASSPQILANTLVGDDVEYSIWTDTECTSGDEDCGYYRDGTVAYHGFGGADKVFLFEFEMPLSGKTGSMNADMPAIWLLNGKIPRTGQYSSCSCWGNDGGCGEADLFEVLSPGSTKAKSTFHFANALGSSDYFSRPTTSYIKLAAVFQSSSETVSIKIIDDDTDFSSSLTSAAVDSFVTTSSSSNLLSTVMSFVSSLV